MHFYTVLITVFIAIFMAAHTRAEPVIFGYYNMKLKNETDGADFSRYTHVNLGFGVPDSKGNIAYSEEYMIPGVVKEIQSAGADVLISLGGWEGSGNFSAIMGDEKASANLIKNIATTIHNNSLNGVDILWEYPGKASCSCFTVDSANDVPKFLQFLKDLKRGLDSEFGAGKMLITISVSYDLYNYDDYGDDEHYYSQFADVVDYAHIIAFGVNGAWQGDTGPYAPLNTDSKGAPYSFNSAIDTWINAGWPPNQLTAGISFEGRATNTLVDMAIDPKNQYQPQSDPLQCSFEPQCPGVKNIINPCTLEKSTNDKWQYKYLRKGTLKSASKSNDYTLNRDNTSMTPWLFNSTTSIFITYDDPKSVKLKISLAAEKGLAGAMVWQLHMDYNNELIDAVRAWPAINPTGSNNVDTSESSPVRNTNMENVISAWKSQDNIYWFDDSTQTTTTDWNA